MRFVQFVSDGKNRLGLERKADNAIIDITADFGADNLVDFLSTEGNMDKAKK